MDGDQGFQLQDLKRVLGRRAGLVGLVAGAVALLTVFVVSILPNQYEAYATLLVEPQVISKRLLEAGLEESDLNNRLHLMTMEIRSRSALSAVIDRFDLYPDLRDDMTREEIIEHMNDRIRVEPILPELETGSLLRNRDLEINTFQIFFRNESPEKAAAVVNALAQTFIDKHIEERIELSGSTSEFLQSELERLSRRVREVENQIARVKAENRGSLPEDELSNQRILERSVDALRTVQREMAISESDLSFYRQQAESGMGGVPGRILTPAEKLQSLEVQLAEYQGRGFTEKHPDVVAAREEIAALRRQIEAGAGEEAPVSTFQSSAEAEARRAELRVASARREMARLQEQIAEYERRLARTPAVAEELAALERQQEHLTTQFTSFSDKLQEASVAADMESRQKGEKFRLLERAYPPTEVASPNRPLFIALGLVLGSGLGMLAAMLAEANDRSFREGRRLGATFGLPVLASIPEVVFDADRAAGRRRRAARGLALALAVLLVLGASLVGNWVVNGFPGGVRDALGIEAEASRTVRG